MGSSSRYDEIADWYFETTRDWPIEPIASLPAADEVRDRRILDMACGHGVASRFLAAHGARVTGVDLSRALLERATAMRRVSSDNVLCHAEADHCKRLMTMVDGHVEATAGGVDLAA